MKKTLLSAILLVSGSLYSMMQPVDMGRASELEAMAAFRSAGAIPEVLKRRQLMSDKDLRTTISQYQKNARAFPGLVADFMNAVRVLNGELMRRHDIAQAELTREEAVRTQRRARLDADRAAARKDAEKKAAEAVKWETLEL